MMHWSVRVAIFIVQRIFFSDVSKYQLIVSRASVTLYARLDDPAFLD